MKKNLCRTQFLGGALPALWICLVALLSLGAEFLSVNPTNVYKGLERGETSFLLHPKAEVRDNRNLIVPEKPAIKAAPSTVRSVVDAKWRAYLVISRST
jgi:hypothetical protein